MVKAHEKYINPAKLPEQLREKHRCLPFRTTFNFRDLGGYPGADGRKTRWGLLFRSGGLKNLSPEEQEYLLALGLKSVVDFRSEAERTKDADQLPESIKYRHMPIDAGGQELRANLEKFIKGKVDLDLPQLMINIYRQLVNEFTEVYRVWLSEIIHSPEFTPQVFHCTAGKDRTGFAAALTLRILEVPDKIIFQDYLLTNVYNKKENIKLLRKVRLSTIFHLKRGNITPMLNADRAYLSAAFTAIDEKWGNFKNYTEAEDGLALSPRDIKKMKELLLY